MHGVNKHRSLIIYKSNLVKLSLNIGEIIYVFLSNEDFKIVKFWMFNMDVLLILIHLVAKILLSQYRKFRIRLVIGNNFKFGFSNRLKLFSSFRPSSLLSVRKHEMVKKLRYEQKIWCRIIMWSYKTYLRLVKCIWNYKNGSSLFHHISSDIKLNKLNCIHIFRFQYYI